MSLVVGSAALYPLTSLSSPDAFSLCSKHPSVLIHVNDIPSINNLGGGKLSGLGGNTDSQARAVARVLSVHIYRNRCCVIHSDCQLHIGLLLAPKGAGVCSVCLVM